MPGLFETPRWDRRPQPVNLDLSRNQQSIHHAIEKTSLFQRGYQVVPQAQGQVSLQKPGPMGASGPALAGSPETIRELGTEDHERAKLIKALQTPARGWQFGPQGSMAGSQTPAGFAKPNVKEQITPFSPDKPGLSGGVPLSAPNIKPGSEDVRVGGVVISPVGTVQIEVPKLSGLAPSLQFEAPSLGAAEETKELGSAVPLAATAVPSAISKSDSKLLPKAPTATLGAGIPPAPTVAPTSLIPQRVVAAPPSLIPAPQEVEFEPPERPEVDQGE